MKGIKSRLTIMNFLEFAVWGSYLTSMGGFLANVGLQEYIGWFYAAHLLPLHTPVHHDRR